MNKICHECGGKGYDNFDMSEMGEPANLIQMCCDNCMGEGYVKAEYHTYIVTIQGQQYYDRIYKNYVFSIEKSVDRPSNPEYQEIIGAWVRYNFGEKALYHIKYAENNVIIDENWNIEDYR